MPIEIFLEYGRVGELSSGRLYTQVGDERTDHLAFEGLAFSAMLYELARVIVANLDAPVFLIRKDRPGSLPYRFDRATVELLRQDPVAAVQALTFPGSPSTLAMRAQQVRQPIAPVIRVGFDLLADAFGTRVCARLLNGEVECPGCGYWSALEGDGLFRCRKRCRREIAFVREGNWAAVFVADLLATSLPNFYLPRRWNPQAWISRAELERMYREFVSEKEKVTCSITQPAT